MYALMQQHKAALAMGTTLAGAVMTPTALLTFNVGDNRCYLLSAGATSPYSTDASAISLMNPAQQSLFTG